MDTHDQQGDPESAGSVGETGGEGGSVKPAEPSGVDPGGAPRLPGRDPDPEGSYYSDWLSPAMICINAVHVHVRSDSAEDEPDGE